MITLAGGQNAASEFSDFKPLTTEALVAANPGVLLLFEKLTGLAGALNGLALGESQAQMLGVNLTHLKRWVLGLTTLAVGSSVEEVSADGAVV